MPQVFQTVVYFLSRNSGLCRHYCCPRIYTEFPSFVKFNLICDRSYLNPFSTSMFYLGMLIGSFVFGNTADRFV